MMDLQRVDKQSVNLSLQRRTVATLRAMAMRLGFVTTGGGPMQNNGNLSALLEAIGSGELAVVPAQRELPGVDETDLNV